MTLNPRLALSQGFNDGGDGNNYDLKAQQLFQSLLRKYVHGRPHECRLDTDIPHARILMDRGRLGEAAIRNEICKRAHLLMLELQTLLGAELGGWLQAEIDDVEMSLKISENSDIQYTAFAEAFHDFAKGQSFSDWVKTIRIANPRKMNPKTSSEIEPEIF